MKVRACTLITPTFPFGVSSTMVPAPGRARGIIERAQEARLGVDVGHDLLAIPDVVAAGDDGNTGAQKVDRDFRRDAASGGSVLAIHDDEINGMLALQLRQPGDDCVAARFTDDVAEEKKREHRADHRIKLENPKLMFRSLVTRGLALLLLGAHRRQRDRRGNA